MDKNFDYSKLSLVLDLGSSKIRGVIGYKEEGALKYVASSEVPSAGIREGEVQNLAYAAGCINGLMIQLNNSLKNKFFKDYPLDEDMLYRIDKVYVGLSAARLQGAYADITRHLAHEEITTELMSSMMEDAKKTAVKYEKQELIGTNLVAACVDGEWVKDVEGRVCDTLIATYHNVYVRRDVISNLKMCLNKVGFNDNDIEIIPSVNALSNLILTNENKQGNVAIVNLGAQVTSISVYEDGEFRYVYESSTGSDKVTKDLELLRIPTELAEKLKKNGNAFAGMVTPYNFQVDGYSMVFESEVIDGIIEDRMRKIIDKISIAIQQVFDISQINMILLTGAGSKQHFLCELMEEQLGCTVRYAELGGKAYYGNAVALGLLNMAQGGSIVVEKKPVVEETPATAPTAQTTIKKTKGTSILKKAKEKVGNLFDGLFVETEEPNSESEE